MKNLEAQIINNYNKIIKDYEVIILNKEISFDDLLEQFKLNTIVVRDDNSDTCIFSNKRINFMFRVWHDYLHLSNNHDFSIRGEINTYLEHLKCFNFSNLEKRVLRIEIVYQAVEFLRTGKFPEDQTKFLNYYLNGKN